MKRKEDSDVVKILKYLLTGNKISNVTCFKFLCIPDLRSRISDLKKAGITVERCKVPGKNYNQYWLPKETVTGYRKHKLLS